MTYAFAYSENKANSTVLVLKCCYHSTMQLNGVFDDGEAEACASKFAASTLVDTIEPLEDTRQMLLRYSNAIVGEGELPMGVGVGMCQGYRGSVARVGYGVVGEIAEDAMDERRIGACHKRGWQLVVEMHLMFLQLQCRSVEDLLNYL